MIYNCIIKNTILRLHLQLIAWNFFTLLSYMENMDNNETFSKICEIKKHVSLTLKKYMPAKWQNCNITETVLEK